MAVSSRPTDHHSTSYMRKRQRSFVELSGHLPPAMIFISLPAYTMSVPWVNDIRPAVFVFLSTLMCGGRLVSSEIAQERQALLDFLDRVPHSPRINWSSAAASSPCDWVGVGCDPTRSSITSLRLPGANLAGPVPFDTIGRLTNLRVISLRSNRLSGEVPDDFSKLTRLYSLYLQDNAFSGEFPTSVTKLTRLNRLDISSNSFSGTISFSINNLTRLTGLFMENNLFSGPLPSIDSDGLIDFNVSNNNLNGSIPSSLSKFPESAFSGNPGLCGGPMAACSPFIGSPYPSPGSPSPNPPHERSNNLATAAIVGIAVCCTVFSLLILLVLLLCLRRWQYRRQPAEQPKSPIVAAASTQAVPGPGDAGTSLSNDGVTGEPFEIRGSEERNGLVFLEGGVYTFQLEDLLRASADVLGKGSIGTSYKAVLEDGRTVVVKRLKHVAASKKEFEDQMVMLGEIKHENLVPLRAFFSSKDEKLLVYDYLPAGSLSALLHGSGVSGHTPLHWDNRLKIAIRACRGLAHLHQSAKVVHGNIKSSNILLHPDHHTAYVSDYGLSPIFGPPSPPTRIPGYRAPEEIETQKATLKSDVYSFGVLLLELLTGKAPCQDLEVVEGIDLPRWVQSVVREEWTAEVFDAEIMRYNNIEEELMHVLQIAMACVSVVPDQRPGMAEVVRMMEEMGRDDSLRQSSHDPTKG
ncbi:hypothetical protein SAY86_031825 [Trapa natans]|uniref:Protein kinase domain-containing protein n=1 Tax=Trapa natans TaxID=22666 RepID=A0AAN7LSK3_TRANT|nr:hypothetical protein SAY86_031825 [Trapa natans]